MLADSTIKSAIREVSSKPGSIKKLTDPGPRGEGRLRLVIRSSESRVMAEWYAAFWRDGKHRLAKLGTYPGMSLADARTKFKDEYAPAILRGGNPQNPYVRRNNKTTRRPATVRELFEAYVKSLEDRGISSAYQAGRILLRREDAAVVGLGADRAAADIGASDVVAVLSAIFDRGNPGQADATRSYIRAAFAFGMKSANDYRHQITTADWGIKANPVDTIPKDNEASEPGSRFLSPAEYRMFWDWLVDQRFASTICDALRIQMLTGQRIKEVLRLQVGSLKGDVLDLGKTKNGRRHGIPLPARAVEIIRTMAPNNAGLYFPHRFERTRHALTTTPNKMTHVFVAASGVPEFTPRDLRRTWKTLAGQAGVGKVDRDIYQNHTLPGSTVSTKHYDWYDGIPDMRANVLPKWEAWLDDVLG